jgi:hypothetical protein
MPVVGKSYIFFVYVYEMNVFSTIDVGLKLVRGCIAHGLV